MKIFTRTFVLLLVCALFTGIAVGKEKTGPAYSDLDQSLQYRISADAGKDNPAYHFLKVGNDYSASLFVNGLKASVSQTGVVFQSGNHSWSLVLRQPGMNNLSLSYNGIFESTKVEKNRIEFTNGPEMLSWYVNGPWGFQQGWTVNNSQPDNEQLTLTIDFSGDLNPSVMENRRGISLKDNDGSNVFNYQGLMAYDAEKKQLPTWFEINGQSLVIKVDDRTAIYPVVIDPWVQLAKLTASTKTAMDYLGQSVAISSDGSTVVAGAWGTDSIAPGPVTIGNTGSVYVYTKPVGGWVDATQTAILIAKVKTKNDYLGQSVAINSDGSVIAAGAQSYDPGGTTDAGAVFVFVKPVGGWVNGYQTAMLYASDKLTNDKLGYSLSMSSDGATIVSGTYLADPGTIVDAGAAYLFTKPGGGWLDGTETAKLTASDKVTLDQLGYNVTVNADGSIVAAGANYAAVGGVLKAGAVYVYKKPVGGWVSATQSAKLTASDKVADDWLGSSVSVNSDGSVIVVGAVKADPDAVVDAGAAYVYVKPVGDWADATETAKLTASGKAASDAFGASVSVNSDGSTIAVGAYAATYTKGLGLGAAYLFTKPVGGWVTATETSKVVASDGANSDRFGVGVSLSSNGSLLAVGSVYNDAGGINMAGAVYVYGPTPTGIAEVQKSGHTICYPNPVTDYLTVTGQGNSTMNVKIYNVIGRIVAGRTMVNGQIDLQGLNPGLYFIKIGGSTFKVMKK